MSPFGIEEREEQSRRGWWAPADTF